jgi:glutathione S-transferase
LTTELTIAFAPALYDKYSETKGENMPTLFYSPGACSLAPHIILEEIGKLYKEVLISTKDGQQHGDEYKKINPRSRVPALQVDDQILTECSAILFYLAKKHPDKDLLPDDLWDQTKCLSWMSFFSSSVHASAVAGVFRNERFTDDEAAKPGIIEKCKKTFQGYMSEIETELKGKTYFFGDLFSVLDAYAIVLFRWGNRMNIDMKRLFPNYTKHAHMMLERPAVQRVLSRENISIWE